MVVKPNRSGGANYKTGYTDSQDHALIGNCRTAALISISGTVASYCIPHFDSPSVFARILDKNHGGHFSIGTTTETTSKQQYLPSTNILLTKFLSETGVGQITDFMPLPADKKSDEFIPWLIRKVEVIRGTLGFHMECAPAFDYARASHTTCIDPRPEANLLSDSTPPQIATFNCPTHVSLDLRWVGASTFKDKNKSNGEVGEIPKIELDYLDLSARGHKGLGVTSDFTLSEGESITFVLREPPKPETSGSESKEEEKEKTDPLPCYVSGEKKSCSSLNPTLNHALLEKLQEETTSYWQKWISQSTYKGRWREAVNRSALAIKLLTFAPTGAIVASPTFSLPEDLNGAGRNWDYRFSWLRDSSFSIYALLRLGFKEEADAYMIWLSGLLENRNEDGGLQIMYTIHGGKEIDEIELPHLDGHKGQKPVRIGNGAANHLQLDIYGEIMDAIYLSQKLSRPISYDIWLQVRDLVDFVCTAYDQPDLSIWEVRGAKQNFTYSKMMCWVAIDRGIRLAEKRSLPAPHREHWIATRDKLYDEIQTRAYNKEKKFYAQSYESLDILDSAVLIAPLVFFCGANDPRFTNTLEMILKPRHEGGLTENSLVYRYDTEKVEDGTGGGEEGSFSMCTLWMIECLGRAGAYNPALLAKGISMLEDFIGYTNHVGLMSEELSKSGEPLGNLVQGFSHVGLISACFNLDRATTTYMKVGSAP